MATMSDLELEVKKLKKRVSELSGDGTEGKLRDSIVGPSPESRMHPTKTTFGDAVAKQKAEKADAVEAEAEAWLRRHPREADYSSSASDLISRFPRLSDRKATEIVSKVRRRSPSEKSSLGTSGKQAEFVKRPGYF